MAGRSKEFDETTVLQQALDLFWRQGYGATSTDELLAAMQLNRGSLYHAFGSKQGVYRRAVEEYTAHALAALRTHLDEAPDPAAAIRVLFRDIALAIGFCLVDDGPGLGAKLHRLAQQNRVAALFTLLFGQLRHCLISS